MSQTQLADPFSAFRNIEGKMLWRAAALDQIDRLCRMIDTLKVKWEIVGSHRSKSIELPVVRLEFDGTKVYVRDNFNDVNVCVVADRPVNIPLPVLFKETVEERDWLWYLDEVARCRKYVWRDWSDEELNGPEFATTAKGAASRSTSAEAKARWLRRMTDPEWFTRDWCHSTISWEGEFGPGTKLWVQHYPYLEGIDDHVLVGHRAPYKPGCTGFALALATIEQAGTFIQRIREHGAQHG